jgi:hypothetical protein
MRETESRNWYAPVAFIPSCFSWTDRMEDSKAKRSAVRFSHSQVLTKRLGHGTNKAVVRYIPKIAHAFQKNL